MTSTADPNTTASLSTQEIWMDGSISPPAVHYTIVGLYVLVTSLGICGNGMVLYLFASKKIRYKSFNLLLLNLSIADLLADIFSYPYFLAGIDISPLRKLSSTNANIACAFTIGLTPFWTVTIVSLYTLGFISLTRCIKIRYPMRCSWITTRRCTVIYIIMAWIIGIGLPSPNFFSFKYVPNIPVCDREYPAGFNGGIYRIGFTLMSFVIPAVVMLLAFLLVACTVWKKSAMLSETSSLPAASIVKRRKAVKLLGALITVFFLCWSPFFIYFFLAAFMESTFRENNLGPKIICGTILAALCNTIADPIVYALRGDEFRKGFKEAIKQLQSGSIFCCRGQSLADVATGGEVELNGVISLYGTLIEAPAGTPASRRKEGAKSP